MSENQKKARKERRPVAETISNVGQIQVHLTNLTNARQAITNADIFVKTVQAEAKGTLSDAIVEEMRSRILDGAWVRAREVSDILATECRKGIKLLAETGNFSAIQKMAEIMAEAGIFPPEPEQVEGDNK